MTRTLPAEGETAGRDSARSRGHRLPRGRRATPFWVLASAIAGAAIVATARLNPLLPSW